MNYSVAYSTERKVMSAVNELSVKLGSQVPKMVLFFASPVYDAIEISQAMKEAFPNAKTVGCTTSGEIVSGAMLNQSLVAMAFGQNAVEDSCIEVIQDLHNPAATDKALTHFEEYYHTKMLNLDRSRFFGMVLIDGLSGAEEKVMERLSDKSDIVFIGGSAGDDLQFRQTFVYSDGKAYSKAALLILIKSGRPFDVIKTQSFCSTGKKLVATRVDEATRSVIEFNRQPARKAYASAVGISESEAANSFMSHPLGLMVGDEPYVRSPQQFNNDTLVFYCNVPLGMELELLASTHIVEDTENAIKNKVAELGNISAIINFNCILRTLELRQTGQSEHYGRLFSDIPTIGFSTYGEQYIGHINQTATMLVFT